MLARFIGSITLLFLTAVLLAAGPASPAPYTPTIAPASEAALKALKRIRVPEGLRVDLFAAEPLLANPVAFCIDHKGRFFVVETFRLHAGVTDIRGHMDWLSDDLACRTVDDRIAMMKRRLGPRAADSAREHDRIRLIEDTKGTGRADRATVFADGFNRLEDGIAAGVVARGSDVWFTCIPDLWLLRDTKGEGKASERKRLHSGFGVHVGFLGHDLHGLRFGPDGMLYFSIGDRAFNVPNSGKALVHPDAGAVLRCNPDGSELEVVATGLRNPQELAFDEFGNLFTCDNNSDAGDMARWVYVVEGGDSGWRIGYQFGSAMGTRGPFMAEDLWKPRWDGQAAYIVPPLANIADGPSGLTYYPGIGLPDRYKGHFFLADFRGSSGGSGIRSLAVHPDGACFKVIDSHEFAWSVLATDVDFGPDCALYLTDWVEGWEKPNKGRIYKVFDPARAGDPAVREVKTLLAEGFQSRPVAELARLLGHADMRVRQEAQYALAGRGCEGRSAFCAAARDRSKLLARLHAIWGLGQVARKAPETAKDLLPLLDDREAEVRAQAAKTLGDIRSGEALAKLCALLKDPSPRVQFFAAQAIGRLGRKETIPAVLAMLRANADKDAYLRHAGVMALAAPNDAAALLDAADDASTSVRLSVLLALRRLKSPDVQRFLQDPDPSLVLEAARAIYDQPIDSALPNLAALIATAQLPEMLGFRVLNAHFRLGKKENAEAVAAFAARAEAPESLRVEALRELGDWAKPAGRDRVMGLWRPLPPRPAELAADAIRPHLTALFTGPDRVRQEAAAVAAKFGIREIGPLLAATAADAGRPASLRIEALRALELLKDGRLDAAMAAALKDPDYRVRTAGRRLLAHARPAEALTTLTGVLESGTPQELQGAFSILGEMTGPQAEALVLAGLNKLLAAGISPEARLDLLDAAAKHAAPAIREKLATYEARFAKGDPLSAYRDCLAGGNPEAGQRLFFQKAEVSCLRCHKIKGVGGEVGPDLTGVGTRQNREYLLESIVDPNRQIAKGFETVVLTLKNGQTMVGVLKGEDAKEVRLMTAEGKLLVVPREQIDEREAGKSAMPEDVIKKLTRGEVRDLIEFLAGLK
jgi:quinoprotein glucose dehydrogenase